MANDKNGSQLFEGDEVVLRARVTHVQGDHVLTVGLEAPAREFWFQGNVVERTAQGAASLDADKHANDVPVAAAPGPISVVTQAGATAERTDVSKREEAIAFVMTKLYHDTEQTYTKEQATAVVDEYGYGNILEDRDAEERQKKALAEELAAKQRKTAGSEKVPADSTAPAASTGTASQAPTGASGSASAQPAAGTPQNEAPKEADGSAPASSSAA